MQTTNFGLQYENENNRIGIDGWLIDDKCFGKYQFWHNA